MANHKVSSKSLILNEVIEVSQYKVNFLSSLSNSKSKFDRVVSKFMMFKELNGNGVGAGKWFENVLVWHIDEHVDGWYALKLNLTNSDWCVHDLLVSTNINIQNGFDKFLEIKSEIESTTSDNDERLRLLHSKLNDEWGIAIGISAKTYKDLSVQLSTSNEPREILDQHKELVLNGQFDLNSFLTKLSSKTNEYQIILALNTFEDMTYRLTNLDLNKLKDVIAKVTYEDMRKHTRFFLLDFNNNKVLDFKYGGKTANPFQRGMWVCNNKGKNPFSGLNVFDAVLEGSRQFNGDASEWTKSIKSMFV